MKRIIQHWKVIKRQIKVNSSYLLKNQTKRISMKIKKNRSLQMLIDLKSHFFTLHYSRTPNLRSIDCVSFSFKHYDYHMKSRQTVTKTNHQQVCAEQSKDERQNRKKKRIGTSWLHVSRGPFVPFHITWYTLRLTTIWSDVCV